MQRTTLKIFNLILCFSILAISCQLQAQEQTDRLLKLEKRISALEDSLARQPKKEEIKKEKVTSFLKNVTIGGVLQTRYVNSLSSGIGHNGTHYGDADHSSSTFDIKRARIYARANISNKVQVNILTNFADFKSDTKTKVLENAFISYSHNRYLNFRIGQFRPQVGPENMIAVDVVKSLDFSNQYYGFGANGWGSFQIGMDVSGSVDLGKIPMSYSIAVLDGNNKNALDNDNGKLFFARDAFRLSKKYNLDLGLNGGWGRVKNKDVYMAAVDLTTTIPLARKWSLYLQGQAGQGTNHSDYFKAVSPEGNLSDNIMRGWFVLPNFRYKLDKKYLHAIEFSCRYEEWEANKQEDNKRSSIIPALSLEFIENYNLRLVIAVQMDRYEKSISSTSKYNSNILTAQLQARF
jgi:hypothetical protein